MKKNLNGEEVVTSSAHDLKVKYNQFLVDPDKRAEFKARLLENAAAGVVDFPKYFDLMKEKMRSSDGFGVIASLSHYGLSFFASSKGIEAPARKTIEIDQHHVELMQAIFLAVPEDELDPSILTPSVMQVVFDVLPKVGKTLLFQRFLDAERVEDKTELLVISLQERVRLHTQMVRNWGYLGQVVSLVNDLLAPIDEDLKKHYGFGGTDFVEVAKSVVDEYQQRQGLHWEVIRKVFRARKPREMLKMYYKLVPDLEGDSAVSLASLPQDITKIQLMSLIMAHFDLRLAGLATFTAHEIATRINKPKELVEAVLDEMSLPLGALVGSNPEFFFLGNPVWDKPFVKFDGAYFSALPQSVFSHINRILDRLVSGANIKQKFSALRSTFLEQKVEALFRKALPDADIRSSVKWRLGDTEYETDLLVVIDKTVLIAEAKSHRLTAEGLRGAPDRVRRHINEMVIDPSLQSERLEKLIWDAKEGNQDSLRIMEELRIDPSKIDRVIRISVTLDDLSLLSSAESEFKKVGWLDNDHKLAPTFLLSDLSCVEEILDNPILFLHYLNERSHFQSSLSLLGDELDFLGLYLLTGFNNVIFGEENKNLVLSGMSEPIDQFFMGREAGIRREKPKPEMRPLFRSIIKSLIDRKPPGWTTVGLHLLSCADPAEQKAIERSLDKLRSMVRKKYRDPLHLNSLQITPSEERKAHIIFHLFPEKLRDQAKSTMEALAGSAFEGNENIKTCVVFGRGTESWGRPYDYLMLAGRGELVEE